MFNIFYLLHTIVATMVDVRSKYNPYMAPKCITRNPIVLNHTICRRYTYFGRSCSISSSCSGSPASASVLTFFVINSLFNNSILPIITQCYSNNNCLLNSNSMWYLYPITYNILVFKTHDKKYQFIS